MSQKTNTQSPLENSVEKLEENPNLKPSNQPAEQMAKKAAGRRKRAPIEFKDVCTESFKQRFFSYVSKKESGCWEWTGAKSINGYGITTVKNTKVASHRVSLIMHGGSFTEEKCCACHTCDNPACVNPEHLWAGSNQDNRDDCVRKKRHVFGDNMWSVRFPEKVARGDRHNTKTHPERIARGERHGSHTHPEKWSRGDNHYTRTNPEKVLRGENHYKAKLTADNVREIRQMRKDGAIFRLISEKFGVRIPTIQNIVARNVWKHVA